MKHMVANIKKYWCLILQLQKLKLMKRMAYKKSFVFSLFAVTLNMVLNYIFINVSFGYFNNLAGWTYYQMLAIIGIYMIIEGMMWVFMGQLNGVSNFISEGTLDGIILKPIDSQFLVSFFNGDIEDFVRIFSGSLLVSLAINNTIGWNISHIFLFVLLLINGFVVLYSINFIVRCFSVWLINGTGLWVLIERITSNSQYPVDIYYHKIVRGLFTFVIPIAFVATVPAKILTNVVIDYKLVLISFLMCALFFTISRLFWKFSLKHYSSASS